MIALKKAAMTASAFTCAALASCISVDYEGIKRESKPKGEEVIAYFDKSQVPVSDYKVMGEATATSPSGSTASEVQAKLLETASDYGADAILITSVDRIREGEVREDQVQGRESPRWNVDDSSENRSKYLDGISESRGMNGGGGEEIYKIRMKAQFLEFPSVSAKGKDDAKSEAPQSK